MPMQRNLGRGGHAAETGFLLLGVATLATYVVLWLEPLWLWNFAPFDGGADYIGTIFG